LSQTVVFVCPHGALKSRLAAAYFNRVAPVGWQATSAGQQPQPAVSVHAVALVAGSEVADLLDTSPPRRVDVTSDVRMVVAIDCAQPNSVTWRLDEREVGEAMRDELRRRSERLAMELDASSG
jgi:protein-tyrosine-phosphatase